ncbi:MAG: hypothetical protein AB3X44_08255 [Leptothrix sp. (in: b-proteobacteria)]
MSILKTRFLYPGNIKQATQTQAEQEVLRPFSEGERRILLELLQRLARLRKR